MSKDTEKECLNFIHTCELFVWAQAREDTSKIMDFLSSLHPNPKENDFPDFIGKNGFVEHFQIAGARETNRGSVQSKVQGKMRREFKKFCNFVAKNGESNKLYPRYISECTPKNSHAYVKDSIQRNWDNHICSFLKYVSDDQFRMFMLDARNIVSLAVAEEIPISVQILTQVRPFHIPNYWLLADKDMMQWIFENAKGINYVIFVNRDRCDIIPIKNLPRLASLLPYNVKIYETPGILMNSGVSFNLPNNQESDDKGNEKN